MIPRTAPSGMCVLLLSVLATIAFRPNAAEARNWLEVVDYKNLEKRDRIGTRRSTLREIDPFFFTQMPTSSPVPSDFPSEAPSFSPTNNPTASPSAAPTRTPTLSPTAAPTTEFFVRQPKDPEK